MPIYEYVCNECGWSFEKIVFGDTEVRCPKCDSASVKKKFSIFGMRGVENKGGGSAGCNSCSSSSCSTCH